MGCGCNKGMKGVAKSSAVVGPIRSQQVRLGSINRTISNQISPIISAQSVPQPGTTPGLQSPQGMDEERRRVERLRREAIKKALNH
jgi:hypothetical protein